MSGGVALLWRSEFSRNIKHIELNVNWCVAVEVSIDSTKFIILNIYMPYQKLEHEDLYLEQLGYIKAFIEEIESTNFVILGDFNANLGVSGTKLFTDMMLEFCRENELIISSKVMLPADTYSYVSSRDGTLYCSWLDHIVSSSDFHTSINNINVCYDISDEDHIPLSLSVSISSLPTLTLERNDHTARISWDSLKECEIRKYFKLTDSNFDNIPIPVDALLCKDLACSNNAHKDTLNIFYSNIIHCLNHSSEFLYHKKTDSNGNFVNKPGWSDYVAELYHYSRELRTLWLENGKPRQGFLFKELCLSKARFKYSLRFIKKNEAALRKESLAKKVTNLSKRNFGEKKKISIMLGPHYP